MERFKLGDIDNERYYQIPKSLFTNDKYAAMSLNAKVIYAFLKDRFNLSRKNRWIDDNGDIFLLFTHSEMAKLLHVSEATTKRAVNELKAFELIFVVRQGLSKPNKIYINKIPPSENETKEQTAGQSRSCKSDTSRSCTDDTSRSCKFDTLMNLNINKPDNNKLKKEIGKTKKGMFSPPTIDEVSEYILENNYDVNAETFVNFYESKGWYVGKNKMRNWQAAVRTWHIKDRGYPQKPPEKQKRQYDIPF